MDECKPLAHGARAAAAAEDALSAVSGAAAVVAAAASPEAGREACERDIGRGVHSPTSQLNLSRL